MTTEPHVDMNASFVATSATLLQSVCVEAACDMAAIWTKACEATVTLAEEVASELQALSPFKI